MEEHSIICDECGAYPVTGTRYKSTKIYDYDCCGLCMKDNHANDSENFVAFETPLSYEEAVSYEERHRVGPEEENRIRASSASEAEDQLRDGGRTAPLAIFRFYHSPSEEECQAVVNFMSSNLFLTNIEIHMLLRSTTSNERAIAILAQGFAQSKSIKLISWTMPCSDRKNPRIATFIEALIEENKRLETLILLRPFYQPACGLGDDELASCLFEALQKNRTLKTFRLDTCQPLSRNTKELASKAVISNPSLIRVHADFEEKDLHLDMLTSFNRNPRWMKCWTDVEATTDHRIRVIEEIMASESDQVVPFVFHLFQNSPESLWM